MGIINKGKDSFFIHGLFIGIAKIFLVIYSGLWIGFILHTIATAILMGLLCKYASDADMEELGRGAITALTLPLLLI